MSQRQTSAQLIRRMAEDMRALRQEVERLKESVAPIIPAQSAELRQSTKPRWVGIARCAARLGISRTHLSRVMHGERKPGKELEKKMRKLGLTPGSAA